MRIFGLFLLCCVGLKAQTAGFGGVAVNTVSGQPMSGVHLKLFTLAVGGGLTDSYGAISGPDGRFSVTGMPPATYLLSAERAGFVHMVTLTGSVPFPSVTLKPGDGVLDYRLNMTPRAAIHARVLDEFGDTVPNAVVEATPVTSGGPVASAAGTRNGSPANLLGEALVSGGPGRFHIKATPPAVTGQAAGTAYMPTWYPSAAGVDRASAVEVAAGADVTIEIRMISRRSITITGTVTGAPPDSGPMVSLASGDRFNSTRNISVGPDGAFQFANLPPALYRVTAYVASGNRAQLQSPPAEIKPDAPETVTLQLALGPGVELSGSIEIAGERPGTAMEKRTVSLDDSSATTGTDGSFRLDGVFPGPHRLTVKPLPENGYIQTVELDGAAAGGTEIDCSRVAAGSRLKITLARDAAQLSGRVLDKDGQPLGDTVAIVILAPSRDRIDFNPEGLVKEGKYSLKGIRPGKYILFAIDAFRSGPTSRAEDIQKLAASAEPIEIKPGDRIVKDIKLTLKEDADAAKQR